MVDQVFTTISKTRLDLAKLLKQHDFDVTLAVNEVQRILQLDNDKRKSIFSLYSKINDNLKKNKSRLIILMMHGGMRRFLGYQRE